MKQRGKLPLSPVRQWRVYLLPTRTNLRGAHAPRVLAMAPSPSRTYSVGLHFKFVSARRRNQVAAATASIPEMKINKETRQLSKELLRASFTDGRLDNGRIASLVMSWIKQKPRNYIKVLESYKRLLRLEVEKRSATIETATELAPEANAKIVANLKDKYGSGLAVRFVVKTELLGGMRIRVGSDVWDSSVRNRLHRLQQLL